MRKRVSGEISSYLSMARSVDIISLFLSTSHGGGKIYVKVAERVKKRGGFEEH